MRIPRNDDSLMGESYSAAAFVCAVGFFIRILFSAPLLNALGIPYGNEDAGALSKMHPGSFLVIMSFVILLFSHGNPIRQLIRIARKQTAFFAFAAIYAVILIYWLLRDPKGSGLIVDIHIVMPLCAIVLSYAPRSYCRFILYGFASLAIVNSLVGLAESATHERLFTFNSDWEVLSQNYFRASAFLGHPLANATFTAAAIFVWLDLRAPLWLKTPVFFAMLASLVAFGGRSALGFTILGLGILGILSLRKNLARERLTVLRLMLAILATLILPALIAGMLYAVLHSGLGERLMAYNSLKDESTNVRLESFHVYDYLTMPEILFGLDSERITAIGFSAGVQDPTSDIENPWILMSLFLGVILFPLWLGGLIACVARLLAGATPALKTVLINYFLIASTSNSFGRKDLIYMTVAALAVSAKRLHAFEKHEEIGLAPETYR